MSDWHGVISGNAGYGLERHKDAQGVPSYIDGYVQTPFGFVIVYGEPRGPRSKPFFSLRFIWQGRIYSRGGNQQSDPTARGLTVAAGRFAAEIGGA